MKNDDMIKKSISVRKSLEKAVQTLADKENRSWTGQIVTIIMKDPEIKAILDNLEK